MEQTSNLPGLLSHGHGIINNSDLLSLSLLFFFSFFFNAGSLPCAEKASQSLSKYGYNSADATPGQAKLPAWATTREDPTEYQFLSPTNLQHPKPPEITSLSSDKKKRTKPSTENSTGLRKHLLQHGGTLPLEPASEGPSPTSFDLNQANRKQADRRLAEAANSVSAHFQHTATSYHKITSLLGAHPFLESGTAESADPNVLDHFNRPGKVNPYKSTELLHMISKPSWVTNRQPPSLPHHFSLLKKGKGGDCSSKEGCELSTGWVPQFE